MSVPAFRMNPCSVPEGGSVARSEYPSPAMTPLLLITVAAVGVQVLGMLTIVLLRSSIPAEAVQINGFT